MLKTEKVFKRFGDIVIKNARNQLKRKNDTYKLYNSLDYEMHVNKPQTKGLMPSFEFSFLWEDYGKYIDEGVRGAGGVRKSTSKFKPTNNKGKLWKIYAKKSRFSFKNIKPSANHFKGWATRKGISPYAVREAVYHQGIKTTHFFSRPFNDAFKYLPDEIVEAYGDDLEQFLKRAL
jgi:hypothetical protein